MLKLNTSIIRETSVKDEKEDRAICIKLEPPGNTIGFRLRYGRQTWTLPVKDAYMAARYSNAEAVRPSVSKRERNVSVKDEIVSVLHAHGKLNIAQVLQRLKEKRIDISKAQTGEWLDTLKQMGKVKQERFDYKLVK
jgi:hypothetical protein